MKHQRFIRFLLYIYIYVRVCICSLILYIYIFYIYILYLFLYLYLYIYRSYYILMPPFFCDWQSWDRISCSVFIESMGPTRSSCAWGCLLGNRDLRLCYFGYGSRGWNRTLLNARCRWKSMWFPMLSKPNATNSHKLTKSRVVCLPDVACMVFLPLREPSQR